MNLAPVRVERVLGDGARRPVQIDNKGNAGCGWVQAIKAPDIGEATKSAIPISTPTLRPSAAIFSNPLCCMMPYPYLVFLLRLVVL